MPRTSGEGTVEWRPPRGDDLGAWADLLAAIEAVDRTGEVITAEDLAGELALPAFDPARDARLAWADDPTPVAWGTVLVLSGAHQHRVTLEGGVRPDWRGRGLGTALLEWQIARGAELAAACVPGLPTWLECSAGDRDRGRAELFAETGFEPVRHYFEMRRDLALAVPDPVVPPGCRLEPFTTRLDAAVRSAHNEAFADHWAATIIDEPTWATFVTGHRGFRPERSFVVLDGEDVAGYALGSEHPDDWPTLGFTEGWTDQLGVRRPWRGRGIARALLRASLRAFADAGRDFAALDVDSENPTGALALYEQAGYRHRRTRIAWSRPVT